MSDLTNMKVGVSDALRALCAERGIGIGQDELRMVVSPYRISPIGAHVDHQGGSVLGRTIDQYTVLAFVGRADSAEIHLTTLDPFTPTKTTFHPADAVALGSWTSYAQAAAAALHRAHPISRGIIGVVQGGLIGAGLSSSASVILAYLHALAHVNGVVLSSAEFVELARQVENEFLGLNNGIQDQTAISFGQHDALIRMDVVQRHNTPVPDPPNAQEVSWMLVYSGFSRELLGSGFNNRVAECREAAQLLHPEAQVLGDVPHTQRSAAARAALPPHLAGRAAHFFSEIGRVEAGRQAWAGGDWAGFGRIMNQSCHSSIHCYESGSQPLVDLQAIALETDGVHGSRFSGGGYGGCLIMLVEREKQAQIAASVLAAYVEQYPDKAEIARVLVVQGDDGVRVE